MCLHPDGWSKYISHLIYKMRSACMSCHLPSRGPHIHLWLFINHFKVLLGLRNSHLLSFLCENRNYEHKWNNIGEYNIVTQAFLPVDPLMSTDELFLFPATALMVMVYLLPGMRLANLWSLLEMPPGTSISSTFSMPLSNCSSYQSTFPKDGLHQTCKEVVVTLSFLISNLAGGNGSMSFQQTKTRQTRWKSN